MQKSRLMKAAVFFIAATFALILLFNMRPNWYNRISLNGENGLTDLTSVDFSDTYVGVLTDYGGREYFAGKLIMPEDIVNYTPSTQAEALSADYATTRTRILVPDGSYVLYGKTPEYASRIYINGELAASFGRIDEENGNIYRTDVYEIEARPENGVIEVITHSAGIIRNDPSHYPINIGSADFMRRLLLVSRIQIMVVLGFYLAGTMFFLGSFMYLPHVKANLWLALIIFANIFRIVTLDKTMFQFFPGLEYRLIFIIENGSLILMTAFHPLFANSMFPGSIPKIYIRVIGAVCVLQSALLLLPIRVTAGFIRYYVLIVAIAALATFVFIVRHVRRFREEQIISFGGQVLFIYICIAEMMATQLQIYPFPIDNLPNVADRSLYGMLFFTFAQMLALFLHNNRSAENERKLAVEKENLENMNRLKTELFGNISHEMKTPLTVISGDIQRAGKLINKNEQTVAQELLQEAWQETMQLANKVTGALALVRGKAASRHMESVDFSTVCETTLAVYEPLINNQGNTLIRHIEKLPNIFGNTDMLVSILINLLTNASNHTNGGTIHISWTAHDDAYFLSVRDNGTGIPAEMMPHIFERGVTDGTGSGFGLSIVKSAAEAHGGTVVIESEEGKGTTVMIRFPARTEGT